MKIVEVDDLEIRIENNLRETVVSGAYFAKSKKTKKINCYL